MKYLIFILTLTASVMCWGQGKSPKIEQETISLSLDDLAFHLMVKVLPEKRGKINMRDVLYILNYHNAQIEVKAQLAYADPSRLNEKVLYFVDPNEHSGAVIEVDLYMFQMIVEDPSWTFEVNPLAEDYIAFEWEYRSQKAVDHFHCDSNQAHASNVVHKPSNNSQACHGTAGDEGSCSGNNNGMTWGIQCETVEKVNAGSDFCNVNVHCSSGHIMTVLKNNVLQSQNTNGFGIAGGWGEFFVSYDGNHIATVHAGNDKYTLICSGED